MPYIKKGPQTEIGRKIQMLAEKLPYKEWYLPDPYNPASYLMPLGLAKVGKGGKRLFEIIFQRNPEGKVIATAPHPPSSADPKQLAEALIRLAEQHPKAKPGSKFMYPEFMVEPSVSPERRLLDGIFRGWDKE